MPSTRFTTNRKVTKPPLGADSLLPGTAVAKSRPTKTVTSEESRVQTKPATSPQGTIRPQLILPMELSCTLRIALPKPKHERPNDSLQLRRAISIRGKREIL